jgi:hypothetical protein
MAEAITLRDVSTKDERLTDRCEDIDDVLEGVTLK